MTFEQAVGLYNYWVVVFLMMTGFYIVIARRNLIKSILGLNIFQTSVFLLYISMGKIDNATTPIVPPDIAAAAAHHGDAEHGVADHVKTHGHEAASHAVETVHEMTQSATGYVAMTGIDADHIVYSNPLPSVLMLTAIVVGIATTSLALALIVRVREDYGTIEEDEILKLNQEEWASERERTQLALAEKEAKANQTEIKLGGSST